MSARSVEATLVFLGKQCQEVCGFLSILAAPSGIGVQIIAHSVKTCPVTQSWAKFTIGFYHACAIFLESPGYKDHYGTAPGCNTYKYSKTKTNTRTQRHRKSKLTMDHACDIFLENPGYKDPYGTAPG